MATGTWNCIYCYYLWWLY